MKNIYLIIVLTLISIILPLPVHAESVRKERKLITEGNELYVKRKFKDAEAKYMEALNVNGTSDVARYNMALSQIRQIVNLKDTTPNTLKLLDSAKKNLSEVASRARTKPGLAAKANYNLGNMEFNSENYKPAIDYYKQALRIDPNDNNARKNLRIAQLKQQQQEQNKDNNQNQDKDQNKDKDKNQDKDQNKDNNKENKDKNKDNNDRNNKEQSINDKTASQILQAIDNKENQTRARVNRANKGEKSQRGGARTRRW